MSTDRLPLMDISNNDVTSSPMTESNRRKSGRAVKAPQKFVPELASSQAGAKRKRSEGQDGKHDASDEEGDDGEESESTIESEADEEIVKPTKKAKTASSTARKPAAKKARVNGTGTRKEAPAVKLPNRSKTTTKKVAIADKEAEGLYSEVYNSGLSSEDVATLWLQRYTEDATLAMADLVNFVLKSAGCDLQVTVDDINDPENVEGRLGDLQEEYQAQTVSDYPLISKAKSSHAFRANFMGFFEQLIEAMHVTKTLYTEAPLIENIHLWTATMSSSTARPFRHTATVAALATTTALCSVSKKMLELAAKSLRQLENLKKERGGNKARLAEIQKRVAAEESNKEFLETTVRDYFETVYVHRYRDVDAKIRTECAAALGDWVLTLPSVFLDSSYLRYMGWTLSDTHAPMRQEVITQLGRIIAVPQNVGTIRHFIERFRPRMIEIATQDSEPTVRAAAVNMMDLIRQAGFLEPDDIDVIGKLILASEPKVRKAVVNFFAESINETYDSKVEELEGDEVLEEAVAVENEEDFESPRAGWLKLKTLAELLLSYDAEDAQELPSQVDAAEFLDTRGSESRFTLAAQALYEKVPELRQWEMIAGYLLYDHSAEPTGSETERSMKAAFQPEEREEVVLLEILNAVVKISLVHLTDSEKTKERGKKRSANLESMEAKETAARRLAILMPRLLKKFGANPSTAKLVLRLEHCPWTSNIFQDLRQDSTSFAKLLDEISAQFNSHADKAVLSEAGAALLHARGYDELGEITENKIQSLWGDASGMLRKINKAGEISVRGAFNNKLLLDLSHNLVRIEELSSISNCAEVLEAASGKNAVAPIDILLRTISRGVFEDSDDEALDVLEDQVALSAIRSSMFYFMWKVRGLMESMSAGEDISDDDIDQFQERQRTFATNLTAAVSSRASLDTVRLIGSGILLDLHVLLTSLRQAESKSKSGISKAANGKDYAHLLSLINEIHPEVQAELLSIFDALEKQYAKRSKKKLAELADDDQPEDPDSDDDEDEEDEHATAIERRSETLKAEQQLCEFTGKLILALLARVIDVSGATKGKLRARIQRNRSRLGPNFKEVIAYLDEPNSKRKISNRGNAQKGDASAAKKKAAKSAEIAVEEEEDDDDDPFAAEGEPEEGTVEDLRRRELLEEEPLASDAGEEEVESRADGNTDDDMLGD